MKPIFVTQRVDVLEGRNETRDSLDQKWASLLMACGLLPIIVPNNLEAAQALYHTITPSGLLLTGGNSLGPYGGDAPMRDKTEALLIDLFMADRKPILGVCRGMQVIQDRFGQGLVHVEGHVAQTIEIEFKNIHRSVNSYHELGAHKNTTEFLVDAKSDDGVIKAISHPSAPIAGVMWHPERETKFCEYDIKLIREFFNQ